MGKYWVFHGLVYYPLGGLEDLLGRYDTVDDAVKALTSVETMHGHSDSYTLDKWDVCKYDLAWAYIWDSINDNVVKGYTRDQRINLNDKVHYLERNGLPMYKEKYGIPTQQILTYLKYKNPHHFALSLLVEYG